MSPEQKPSFGVRLRGLREAAGLTQEELALRASLTPNAVGDLERGKTRRPYPHTVRSLSDALGLSEEARATLMEAVPSRGGTGAKAPAGAFAPEAALPSPPTPLLGRERELREIRGLLLDASETRLLTLTGIGGVGKTRLAIAAAREIEDQFHDGALFVGLASVSEPALVVPTVATSLGLRETDGRGPREALRAFLRAKRMLLVLDNFEHLLEVTEEVAGLIEACPGILVLTTSRAPLRIRGEQEYPVQPLVLPSPTQYPTEEEVLATPSGRLFAERARAASPSFAITIENAAPVAAICWRLAGLPLAIELAAAKARFLEPAALLSRLDQALSTAWARDLPERQRTMRAALDWSYELLSESERRMFRRLSVFVGGFTLEAAEAVAADEQPGEALGLLGALVEQSLVVARSPEGVSEARYAMLEPVRQYALELLDKRGEAEAVRRLHAAYFLALAELAAPELKGPDQLEWLGRLDGEKENLRASFSWALGATGSAQIAARLGWALQIFLSMRGYHREGRRWAEETLERQLPDALRARTLHLAAQTAYMQGDHATAGERWSEALDLSQRAGDFLVEANSRSGTGVVDMIHSDYDGAIFSQEEAIALFERCSDGYGAAIARVLLGLALLARGRTEGARETLAVALELSRSTGNPLLNQIALFGAAQSALAERDYEEAGRMLRGAIVLSTPIGDRVLLAQYLETLAEVAASWGEAERAAVLLGASEGLLGEVGALGYNAYDPDLSVRKRRGEEVRAVLGDAAFEEELKRGGALTFEQAVQYALERDEASAG